MHWRCNKHWVSIKYFNYKLHWLKVGFIDRKRENCPFNIHTHDGTIKSLTLKFARKIQAIENFKP